MGFAYFDFMRTRKSNAEVQLKNVVEARNHKNVFEGLMQRMR